ncbi:hypothetical protein EDB89DRAFT_1827399, partial [Lactarius sanguifluus]
LLHPFLLPVLTMQINLDSYQSALADSTLYVTNPLLKESVVWCQGKSGNILNNQKNKCDAVMCMVGHMSKNRLNCDPQGNFSWKYRGLKMAKFQIQLSKPFGTAFEDNFQKGIDNMSEIQRNTATTGDLCYFICMEG